ncbi:MAG: hypothetical protein M5U34_23710 [Chloroflexi bacterium]|nr:hypothetical protein [Chloroflexota bacterium]
MAVGKMKTKHWLAAQQDYEKRLGYYTTFTLKEVKDAVGRGLPDEVAMQKRGNCCSRERLRPIGSFCFRQKAQ